MTPTYATLAQAHTELKTPSTNVTDDPVIFERARQASQRLDRIFQSRRPLFFPYSESRQFRISMDNVNSVDNTLTFSGSLLELASVIVGSTTLALNTVVQAWPTLASPIHQIRLMNWGDWWTRYCVADGTPLMITIAGIWGLHRDYSSAWLSVDALAAGINASVTAFTVASVAGADGYGYSPRISQGNLIRVDSEYMEVISTVVGTNTVNVKRGVNGTTAASHLISASVDVWQVEEPVKRAVARQAAFMYARRGSYESSTISDMGVINFPSDILAEVRGIAAGYQYE